jgi:hypothetical protein
VPHEAEGFHSGDRCLIRKAPANPELLPQLKWRRPGPMLKVPDAFPTSLLNYSAPL